MIDKYSIPQWLRFGAGQRQFHVMAKPAGSTCNLDCTYCFYLSKETLPNGPGAGQMGDEVLELFHPAIHRGRHRSRSGVFLAGRRADAARPRLLPQGRRAAKEVREARPADRERPADQRHAARRGLGGVPEGAPLPRRPEHRRPARAARPLPRQQRRRADVRQGVCGGEAAAASSACRSTR